MVNKGQQTSAAKCKQNEPTSCSMLKRPRQMERSIVQSGSMAGRQVHFFAESQTARTPLERLTALKQLAANGLLAEQAVTLVFSKNKSMSFPANSMKEVESFARLVRVMALLEDNLKKNHIATRRDIYYQDVELFQCQQNVDVLMELLARSLDMTGDDLGAVASQKGLLHGGIKLTMSDGTSRSLCQDIQDSTPILIPRLTDVKEIYPEDHIDYILVVEKEAIFNALATHTNDQKDGPPFKRIIITAKGYPDILTRTFLHMLTEPIPHVPVFGFSDFDPYGLQILKQYKTGRSRNNTCGKSKHDCPHLQLTDASIVNFFHRSCCLSLPLRDFLQCRSNLSKWPQDQMSGNWRRETQRMMFFGKKAELDVIKTNDPCQEQEQVEIVGYIEKQCRAAVLSAQKTL